MASARKQREAPAGVQLDFSLGQKPPPDGNHRIGCKNETTWPAGGNGKHLGDREPAGERDRTLTRMRSFIHARPFDRSGPDADLLKQGQPARRCRSKDKRCRGRTAELLGQEPDHLAAMF